MNQILATSENQKNNKKRHNSNSGSISDIKTVIKVFVIVLIIFSIFIIGTGSYALYKNSKVEKTNDNEIKPTIIVENVEENSLVIKVSTQIGIEDVVYKWNDENDVTLNGNGGGYIEQKIQIPNGTNNLNIVVTDTRGNQNEFNKEYVLNSNIKLKATEDGKIKILYEGETEISYMTYRWDEREEEKIDINDKKIDYDVKVLSGRHTLTVSVVDVNNNTETKVQETSGISIPEIKITFNANKTGYLIKVFDSIELKELRVMLDGDENKKYNKKLSGKEFQFEIPFKEGDNKIKIEVVNSDDKNAKKLMKFKV